MTSRFSETSFARCLPAGPDAADGAARQGRPPDPVRPPGERPVDRGRCAGQDVFASGTGTGPAPCPRARGYLSGELSAGLAMLSILTTRESAILAMLAEGLDNKTIARQLGIRETTVKAHMTAILTKLGVTSRLQAGLVAFAACLDGQLGQGPAAW